MDRISTSKATTSFYHILIPNDKRVLIILFGHSGALEIGLTRFPACHHSPRDERQ